MTDSDTDTQTPDSGEKHTLIVGLTGGIGSGKTTVANGFIKLGVPVIDADQLARELVEAGQPALDEIISAFGPEALTAAGQLDRKYLQQRIFSDSTRKARLEAILHPKIRQRIRTLLAGIKAPYCIVVIPLLLETRQIDLVDRILVVDSSEKDQLIRVAARDKLSENAIKTIMNSQANRNTRLAAADDIIDNSGDINELTGHIQKLHRRYTGIAHDN